MENPYIEEDEIPQKKLSDEELPDIILKNEIETGEPIPLDYRPESKNQADYNRRERSNTQRKISRLRKELTSIEKTDEIKVKDLRAGAEGQTGEDKDEAIKQLEDKLRQLEDKKKQLEAKMEKIPTKRQTNKQERLATQVNKALEDRGLEGVEAEVIGNQVLKDREKQFIDQNKRQIAATEFLKGKQEQKSEYLKAESLIELANLIREKELVKDANGVPIPTEKIIATIKNAFNNPALWRYFSRDGGLRDRMIDITNDYRRRWSAIYLEAKSMDELYDIIKKSRTVMIKKEMYTPEELINLIKEGRINELPSPALKDMVMLLTTEENLKQQRVVIKEKPEPEVKQKNSNRFKRFWHKLKIWRK